jgi:hypothetical protein
VPVNAGSAAPGQGIFNKKPMFHTRGKDWEIVEHRLNIGLYSDQIWALRNMSKKIEKRLLFFKETAMISSNLSTF